MNESQINETIRALAEQLGTTGEYLWSALLRQAPISGTTSAILLIVLWAATVALAIGATRARRVQRDRVEHRDIYAADEAEVRTTVFGGLTIVLGLISMAYSLDSVVMIAAAFFNPEYWALKQLF